MTKNLIFILILFASCSQNKNCDVRVSKKYLFGDSTMTNNLSEVITINNEDYLLSYDPNYNFIRLFNLHSQDLQKLIPLPIPKNFTDKEPITGIYASSFDSIFLVNPFSFRIIDTLGDVKYAYNFRLKETDSFPFKSYCSYTTNAKPYFNREENMLYIKQNRGNLYYSDTNFYKHPIEASFDLTTKKFEDINIFYLEEYLRNNYGQLFNTYKVVVANNIVFTFDIDPNIYTYNIKTKQKKVFNCQSIFQKVKVIPLPKKFADDEDVNRSSEHFLQNPVYIDLIYDKYRNCYYRFLFNKISLQKPDGTYNNLNDKQKILMVIDSNFKIINEIELPRRSILAYSFVTKEGLFVYQNDNIKANDLDSTKKIRNINNEKGKFLWYNVYTPVFN